MTRTEDRLADALAAVARSVREENLPPLRARGGATRRLAPWLAPLAAAASVTLIVVLLSAIHLAPGRPHGGGAGVPAAPRYYATMESFEILIRSTATGAVVSRVSVPHLHIDWMAASVAMGGGGRFVAAYSVQMLPSNAVQTRLYSFHLSSIGHVTGLTLVKGGVIDGLQPGMAMAVSPDGTRVALAMHHQVRVTSPAPPAGIMVVDMRTGARGLWYGGLTRPGFAFSVPSISWAQGGRSLVFLAQWCRSPVAGGFCGRGAHDAQVRSLHLASGLGPAIPVAGIAPAGMPPAISPMTASRATSGLPSAASSSSGLNRGGLSEARLSGVELSEGQLSRGSVLLRESARYPDIVQALSSPSGKAVTLVVLRPPYLGQFDPIPQDLRVVRVPLAGGEPALLYHGVVGSEMRVFLGSDPSGRHLLLSWRLNGWLDHGTLHKLAPQGGYAFVEAW